jgi:hypothetical protein
MPCLVTRERKIRPVIVTLGAALMLVACVSATDPQTLKQSQTMDLCESYASSGPQPPFGQFDVIRLQAIKTELARRAAVPETEWPLIDQHEARVGMDECALRASWGHPMKVSHTVTAGGDSAQYVFGTCPWEICTSKQYAYVAKGHVIGLQY